METDHKPLKLLIASLIIIVCVEMSVGWLAQAVDKIHGGLPLLMWVGSARILEISLILTLAWYFTGGFAVIGLTRDKLYSGFKTGLLWSLSFAGIVAVIGGVLFYTGVNPIKMVAATLPEAPKALVLFLVVGGVVGPLAEELFFRGVCYGYFRKWGILSALIITTGIFVAAHAIKDTVPTPQIVGGMVFALSYEFSKSLVTPIVIHITGNLAIFALSLYG